MFSKFDNRVFSTMRKQAVKVGFDMLVLDDGWFGQRNSDRSSLGDWVVSLEKFPQGLKALVDEINAIGLKFGIWVEPEMVSEQSVQIVTYPSTDLTSLQALFTTHPDWAFQIPGRPRQIGRNQMVLDLSRQDVRDHIYRSIASVLTR